MKKIATLFSLVFILWFPLSASAAEQPVQDPQWTVSPEVYNILRERAGIAVYTHRQHPVDLTKVNLAFSKVYEQTPNYILGRPINTKDYMIITKDGFYAAYTSKEKGAAIDPSNGSMLWRTLRNNAFEDIYNDENIYGYFHFGQSQATDLIGEFFFDEDFILPAGTTVHEFSMTADDWYKQLPVDMLKTGEINEFSKHGFVNGIALDEETMWHFRNILFLTSGEVPELSYNPYRLHWKLENWLYPAFKDVSTTHWAHQNITWAFRTGLIQGFPDGRFQPGALLKESDLTVIAAKFFGFQPGTAYGHRTQQYYDFLKPYNLPLKGYSTDTGKNSIVTRGQLAQIIAASQGAPYGPKSAVGFMYKHGLSYGKTGIKTFEDYGYDEKLTRAQISAFFERMETLGMTALK